MISYLFEGFLMSTDRSPMQLPDYDTFVESIAVLGLPFSGSEIHGVMCAYLCAGSIKEGEAYLRALITNRQEAGLRSATLALFGVYAVSQQQISGIDFEFQLLLPEDDAPLLERAQAFSEWCEGFTQGMRIAGIADQQFHDEEAEEAFQHLAEFAELDYDSLEMNESDERALMEVSEYARMAVLQIYLDLHADHRPKERSETAH